MVSITAMPRSTATVPALVAIMFFAAPCDAQNDRASALFEQVELAYPQSKVPALYGPGSASEAYSSDPTDAVWAAEMESRILALLQQEQDRGLLVNRAEVECRTAVCALLLIHVAISGEASVAGLVDSLDRSLPFASVSRTVREIPIQSESGGMTRTSFMPGYVEIVLVGAPRVEAAATAQPPQAAASTQAPPVPQPDPVRPAPTVPELSGQQVTTPALPGIPEYAVRRFRADGMAAQSLATEPDDPQWSGGMEARIRQFVAGEMELELDRLEVECRTTRCGLLAVHAPDAERAGQSEILSRLQSTITDALGFEGSIVGSIGQTDASRFTVLYFEGFPNLGPPRALPVWLLSFGLAQDPREQLMVADEIVQAQSPGVLSGMAPWLDAASVYARANAAYVFARYGDPRGMATLNEIAAASARRGFLGSTDRPPAADEVEHLVYVLGILDDPGVFEALWSVLEGQIVGGTPTRAVERALRGAVAASVTPFLIRQLEGREPLLRAMAIQLLAGSGASTAVPALATLLEDQARPFRGRPTTVGDLAREAIATIRAAEERIQ